MLTPEREKEIRQWAMFIEATMTAKPVSEILVEIDRLRTENKDLHWEYENVCKFATAFEQERDQLREKLKVAMALIDRFRTCGDAHCERCKPLAEALRDLSKLRGEG